MTSGAHSTSIALRVASIVDYTNRIMSLMACSVSFFGRSAVGLANRLVDERFILEARTQDWPYGAEEAEVIVEGAALASTGTLSGLLTIRRPLTKR